jgi:DNA replication protein DnaC
MLTHPTLNKLRALRLTGMLESLQEQLNAPDIHTLDFDERLALLVDREMTERHSRRLNARLKQAGFQQPATWEDIDLKSSRGLDKSLLLSLSGCQWVAQHLSCLITGPTGAGKSYLAIALAHKACREGYTARYYRLPRLLQTLHAARGDGSYPKLLKQLARFDVLVIDDWGLASLHDQAQRDLLEILDDRYNCKSTIVTSQLPVSHWHEYLGDATLADAILDRLVHNAYKIELKGESMRKKNSPLTQKPSKG